MLTGSLGMVVFSMNNCAGGFRTNPFVSNSSSQSVGGISVFRDGLYAFGQQKGCVNCHGSSIQPLFAAADINSSYSAAKSLVNFADPSSSAFITYASNAHCGLPLCSNVSASTTVSALLAQWAQAETTGSSSSQPANYMTVSAPVPANLPTLLTGNTAVVRFQLSKLNPSIPALQNAVFEVEMQVVSEGSGEYRLSRPKLMGNSSTVTLSGIHVYIRPSTGTGFGSEDTQQGIVWASISAMLAPSALPNPLPAAPLPVTPLTPLSETATVQSTSDFITIGFDQIAY